MRGWLAACGATWTIVLNPSPERFVDAYVQQGRFQQAHALSRLSYFTVSAL
jgi:hypothetical protein